MGKSLYPDQPHKTLETNSKEVIRNFTEPVNHMLFYMIGDSHVSAWNGLNNYLVEGKDVTKYFRAIPLVPIQAYMLGEPEDHNSIQKLFFDLVRAVPKDDYIIPVVGEVDIRTTIARRITKEHTQMGKSILITMNSFRKGIEKLLTINEHIALLSPNPIFEWSDHPVFCQAPLDTLYKICKAYDKELAKLAAYYNLKHFTIIDQVYENKMYEDLNNRMDWCHWRGEVIREMLKPQFYSHFGIDITELK